MKNELNNLLKQCANPVFCVWTTLFFMRRVLFSLQYRYLPSRWYYPKVVREAFSRVMQSQHSHPERSEGSLANASGPTFVGDSSVATLPQNDKHVGRLKLATGFFEYDGEPDWQKKFDDTEQTMSLHRWGWLIYDGMDKDQGLVLVRSWLKEMGPVPGGIAGTTYTTSERIVNALLFFSHDEWIPEDLHAALLKMAYHVARHIEYHGVRGTGNHVVNNARALFFAGQLLGVKELSNLALAIVQDALPWLITEDGFLREESSHYHLLFTRWIFEMYELAKNTGHEEIEMYLAPWIKKLVEQCWFFLVQTPTPPNHPLVPSLERRGKWQIPLIGDVSPDCTPEWLIKYLTPYLDQYAPSPPIPLPRGEGGRRPGDGKMRAYPDSGWFRLDRGTLTVFWHIPQSTVIHRATHGHGDLCSFVLFYAGKSVLIDPGRPTYQGDKGCLAKDHNSLTIDGLDPFLYDRAQKFPVFYQKRTVECAWREDEDNVVFSITHTGFHRIKDDRIHHLRKFRFGDRFLEVEDSLSGTRSHRVEMFFHPASQTGVIVEPIQNGGLMRQENGWTSPEYGVTIPAHTIAINKEGNLPFAMRHRLVW